jgi:hypothetical protein
MAVRLVDPGTGIVYSGPEDQEEAARAAGLVTPTPEQIQRYDGQKEYDAKPIGDKVAETATAAVEGFARPFDAADEWLNSLGGGVAPSGSDNLDALTGAPSDSGPRSPEARQRAERHPIAAGVGGLLAQAPLLAAGGVPGAIARVGAAAILGSAEDNFAQGSDYVPDLRDATIYGGIQAAFEGAVPIARGLRGALGIAQSRHAVEFAEQNAARASATARLERDAGRRQVRTAAEADLHFDRLARASGPELEGVSELLSETREKLIGRIVDKAKGAPEDVARAYQDASTSLHAAAMAIEREGGEAVADSLPTLRKAIAQMGDDIPDAPAAFSQLLKVRNLLVESETSIGGLGGALDDIDEVLKRSDAWGKAADRFAQVTGAGTLEAAESSWSRVTGELFDANGRADAGKVRSLLRDPVKGDLLRRDVNETLQALEGTAPLLRRTGDIAGADKVAKQTSRLRDVLAEADEVFEARRTARLSGAGTDKLAEKLSAFAANRVSGMAGAAAGSLLGGLPGMALGWGVGQAAESFLRSKLAGLSANRLRDVAFTARNMVARGSLATAKRAAGLVERSSPAVGQGASAAWRSFVGDAPDAKQAYARSVRLVNQSPEELQKGLLTAFAGVDDAFPDNYADIALHAFRVQNFLREKMPKPRGVSLMNPIGLPPPRSEMRRWALYYTAAMNPSTVFEDLAFGRGTVEQVETLKAIAPHDYDDLRTEAIGLITQGARPSMQQRARLAMLFDLKSADPFMSPSVGMLADQARNQRAQQQQRGSPPGPSQAASAPVAKGLSNPQRTLDSI